MVQAGEIGVEVEGFIVHVFTFDFRFVGRVKPACSRYCAGGLYPTRLQGADAEAECNTGLEIFRLDIQTKSWAIYVAALLHVRDRRPECPQGILCVLVREIRLQIAPNGFREIKRQLAFLRRNTLIPQR